MEPNLTNFFSIKNEIGRGAYGTVYLAILTKPFPPLKSGAKVAIKSIPVNRITTPQEKEKLDNEIRLMSKLDHPNIVKFYGVQKSNSNIYLILEFCNGGDLFNFMNSNKDSQISEDTICEIASQITNGLLYLHSHQIVHRDLKPHNILVSRDEKNYDKFTLKIADFGFARFLRPCDLATTVCGSPVYMAPEIQYGIQYSSNVDMWSLGIILYELITKKTPFPHVRTQYELAMELKSRGARPYCLPASVNASQELRNLIQKLLTIDPKKRMTFEEFTNDPFIHKNSKDNAEMLKNSINQNDDLIDLYSYSYEEEDYSESDPNEISNQIDDSNLRCKPRFSFLVTFPDIKTNKSQTEDYLIEARESAETIATHFTEIQIISNKLLVDVEVTVIQFLFDFLREAKKVFYEGFGMKSNSESKRSNNKRSSTRNANSLLKAIYQNLELLTNYKKELSSILEAEQIALQKEQQMKGTVQKTMIYYNKNPETAFKKEDPKMAAMEFLYNKAIEYTKEGANFEIDKDLAYAAIKYKKALCMLSPIVFSLESTNQIKTARAVYKKINSRIYNISKQILEK